MAVAGVMMYLTSNIQGLKKFLKPLLDQRRDLLKKEDPALHSEIQSQFEQSVREQIANEIATNLNLNPQEVYEVVENMNVKEFLGE